MATKRSIKDSSQIGVQMAEETLKRRRAALKQRKAAIANSQPTRQAKAASAAIRSGISVGTLIAEGDSWFDYPFNDVLKDLEDKHGYDVESVAHAGDKVEDMAYSGGQLDDLVRQIEKVARRGDIPKAILLSGGGNDIAGKAELGMLLNHASSSTKGLNAQIVDGVINQRLYDAYATILTSVSQICQSTLGKKVPIVLHGYDYAIADGRGFAGGFWFLPGPWLEPGFREKGYMDMTTRNALIVDLINQFNQMLITLTSHAAFSHVHYVDLRGTLKSQNYKDWWANELHPTKKGFASVSDLFAAQLTAL